MKTPFDLELLREERKLWSTVEESLLETDEKLRYNMRKRAVDM